MTERPIATQLPEHGCDRSFSVFCRVIRFSPPVHDLGWSRFRHNMAEQ